MILFRKARRRSPGIYVFRTRRHLRRGTEFGYVGKANHLALRRAQHEAPLSQGGKPWADLITGYWALHLPWWLGWQWVTLSLETVVIALLRPRYNWQKNPRHGKVPPRIQALQRQGREVSRAMGVRPVLRRNWTDIAVRCAAVLLILAGLSGWLLTR